MTGTHHNADRIAVLITAAGRGSRMGGVDKGLQTFRGTPLAMHALLRLQTQTLPPAEVMVNANRNLAAYESFGVPVWPDALPDFAGPLAGFLTGLVQALPAAVQWGFNSLELLLMAAAMAALYHFVPNTPVRWRHAWAEGIFVSLGLALARKLLGLYLAQVRGMKYGDEIAAILAELDRMPALMQEVLDNQQPVLDLAKELKDAPSVLFLGRHVGYPVALEGALKLKELAYIHAEGFAAGELKHGPIALVSEGLPIFVVVPPAGRDQLRDKVISNIAEVRARGARTIVLAEAGDVDALANASTFIELPKVSTLLQPLLSTIPLQIFACELATLLGHDVDQPRNLAKSVTVE